MVELLKERASFLFRNGARLHDPEAERRFFFCGSKQRLFTIALVSGEAVLFRGAEQGLFTLPFAARGLFF